MGSQIQLESGIRPAAEMVEVHDPRSLSTAGQVAAERAQYATLAVECLRSLEERATAVYPTRPNLLRELDQN